MSIRTLLFLVILLLGGGSVVGQLLIQEFQREFDTQLKRSEKEHQELLQLVGHMRTVTQKMHLLALSSSIRRSEDLLLQSSQQPREFFKVLMQFEKKLTKHPELSLITKDVIFLRKEFRRYIQEILSASSRLTAGTEQALQTLSVADNMLEKVDSNILELEKTIRHHIEVDMKNDFLIFNHKKTDITYTVIIFTLLLTLFMAWFITRRVSNPLRKINGALSQLTQGDYSSSIDWHQSDEFGSIAESYNQMVRAIQSAHRKIEQQSKQAELIIQSINEGLVLVDPQGIVKRVNNKLLTMTGKPASALIGSQIDKLFVWSDQEPQSTIMELLNGHLEQVLGGDDDALNQSASGRALLKAKGEELPVHISGALIQQEVGASIEGAVLVLRDLSLLLSIENAKQTNRAKDEFLASMSHELRTPLTSIIGNSEYLSEKIFVPELKEIVRDIEMAGRGQLALVNYILDMSKIESGKFTIDETPYNLDRLLDSIERMVTIRVQDAGLKLVLEQKNQEKFQLVGDSQRIAQILINLLGNAIKFTKQGQITLTTWVEDQQLNFQVKDTGIGMSSEEQEHLFKRFEQADSSISKRFGGSGLGLYISMNLAKLMGGDMNASSQSGQGSTFMLSLPYNSSDVLVEKKDWSAARRVGVAEQFSGHVLVAEDTPALQLLEKRILENMGVTVTTVTNGEEAINQAMTQPYDLILMDMQMPVMDGIEATQQLKELGNQIPVVALTANVMARHRDQFEQAGCSGFLAKPIDKDELRAVLREYLSSSAEIVDKEIEIIEWDDSYSVGNQLLDEQHQQIVAGINEMVSYCRGKHTQESYARTLGLLSKVEHIVSNHIKDEERLLDEINYPELESHIQAHRHYTDRLSRLFQKDIDNQTIVEITRLMLTWWNNHILIDDVKFKPYFKQNEVMRLPIGYRQQEQLKLDDEIDEELIAIFKESATNNKQMLIRALSEKDWKKIKEVAHPVKGSGTSFGFPALTNKAGLVCDAYDQKQLDQMPELTMDLILELGKATS